MYKKLTNRVRALKSTSGLLTFGAFHMTKNTRLSTPAQLQCLCSGAWEPGNEPKPLLYFRFQFPFPFPFSVSSFHSTSILCFSICPALHAIHIRVPGEPGNETKTTSARVYYSRSQTNDCSLWFGNEID